MRSTCEGTGYRVLQHKYRQQEERCLLLGRAVFAATLCFDAGRNDLMFAGNGGGSGHAPDCRGGDDFRADRGL
jgi:hypothetical protein